MTEQASSGLLLVVSGPSGVGKTTIVHRLRARLGGRFSVSATTRPMGPGEVDGEDYLFVTPERFEAMLAEDAFLEHAEVFGRHAYGTPRGPVEDALDRGELIVLDIDVQGAMQVRTRMPRAYMVFILPPSDAELRRRLESRGRDEEEAITRRHAEARREIDRAMVQDVYDVFIVNDDLDHAVDEACRLVSERRQALSTGA